MWWLIPLVATLAAIVWLAVRSHRAEKVSRRDLNQFGAAMAEPLPETRVRRSDEVTEVRIVKDDQ